MTMTQFQYNDIIKCIQFGMPAKSTELITELNNIISYGQDKFMKEITETETETEVKEKK